MRLEEGPHGGARPRGRLGGEPERREEASHRVGFGEVPTRQPYTLGALGSSVIPSDTRHCPGSGPPFGVAARLLARSVSAWTEGAAQPSTIPGLNLFESQVAPRNGNKHFINLMLGARQERPSASFDKEVHCKERGSLVSVREPMIRDKRMSQRSGLAPDPTVVA